MSMNKKKMLEMRLRHLIRPMVEKVIRESITSDWLITTYDENDEVIEKVVVKDRTEDEAAREAENYVEQDSSIEDWTIKKISRTNANKYPEL